MPKSDKPDLTNAFINAAIRAERFGRTGSLSHVPPVVASTEAPAPAQG